MKNTFTKIGVLILLIFIIFISLPNCGNSERKNDKGNLVKFIIREDTQYSEEYDEIKFKQIKIGMVKSKVLKLLGSPLSTFTPYEHSKFIEKKDYVSFVYSRSPSGKNYELRQVIFNDSIVAEIDSYFYID